MAQSPCVVGADRDFVDHALASEAIVTYMDDIIGTDEFYQPVHAYDRMAVWQAGLGVG